MIGLFRFKLEIVTFVLECGCDRAGGARGGGVEEEDGKAERDYWKFTQPGKNKMKFRYN